MNNTQSIMPFVISYLKYLKVYDKNLQNYFAVNNFNAVLVLKLPQVCLLKQNRNSTSKQTHIHITGNNMYFFYEKELVDNTNTSTDWEKLKLDVFLPEEQDLIQESYTNIKIGCRKTQAPQVQISKIAEDENGFIKLRKTLFEKDLLIFLKNTSCNKILALRIDREYCEKQDFNTISTGTFSIQKAITTPRRDILTETLYQNNINNMDEDVTITEEDYMPEAVKEKITTHKTKNKVSAINGKKALKLHSYKCLVDENHETFIKENGEKYLEAHHLVPMSKQDYFDVNIDKIANIIPLCPNCHRKIHYGKTEEIIAMLKLLYEKRKPLLEKAGINTSLENLLDFYLH